MPDEERREGRGGTGGAGLEVGPRLTRPSLAPSFLKRFREGRDRGAEFPSSVRLSPGVSLSYVHGERDGESEGRECC